MPSKAVATVRSEQEPKVSVWLESVGQRVEKGWPMQSKTDGKQ